MRTIWKYPLDVVGVQKVTMQIGAVILSVQRQADIICLWAEVDTERGTAPRTIEVIGTGRQISVVDNRRFIGTVQEMGGSLIWHVYERTTDNIERLG